jgi:prolycopene isomerase
VPADFDTYLARLKNDFPQEVEALDRFFVLVRKLYLLGVMYYFRGIATKRLDRYLDMTLRDALDRFFQSERLKLILSADVPHWGAPPKRVSFVFDSMLRWSYFLGNFYPQGGSQRFADELARRFQDCGGDILLQTMVRRIVVRNRAATGVTLELGRPRRRHQVNVQAGAVLANGDMRLTVEKLVGTDHFDPAYVARIRGLRVSFPCFLSHLGVRGIPTSLLQEAQGYYWRGWDGDRVACGDFDCKVFVPTLYAPSLAPPDGHVVIVQKMTDIDYDRVRDWKAYKKSLEDFVLARVERAIPGLRERMEVCLSATARTLNRFTLNYQGAAVGWEMSPQQLGPHRPAIQSPLKNLYFVGQWTQPGGGITPVIVSAMRAADAVTRPE